MCIRDSGPGADHWHWSDGRPWTYTNWHRGEPNNAGGWENRVHLGYQAPGTWNDVDERWSGPAVYELSPETSPPTTSSKTIEILEAVAGKPVRFRISNRPSSNDAWVGIYPAGAADNDHGAQHQRWHWLRDIDVNNASFPAQSAGRWSIRVFSDGGFTLHHSEDFEIEDGGSNEFDNFSESMLSKVAAFEKEVMEGRITVEEARAIADAEAKTQIENLPFFLRSPAEKLWKANADKMQIEVTSRLAERTAAAAAGAAVVGTVAGAAAASRMQETPEPLESATAETEYSSHDDWHEEYSVEVPDRVEVDTEVEIPEYEDPDEWYESTKVDVETRVSVPERVTVGTRRRSSVATPPVSRESVTTPQPTSQEVTESSSELSSMSSIAAAFSEARMLTDQRNLADSLEGKTFQFEFKPNSDPERTFGIGIEDAYRGGLTVIGEVPEVGEVEVRFASGADSSSMSKGRGTTISASISGWNGIRKRLIVNAQ